MPDVQLPAVLRHIRGLVDPQAAPGPSDAQLLERFARHREEAAFTALVRRHGRLVLGVCRRVLRQEQDAEDAFQATFLALARQAGSLRASEAVGSWLYRVAYRIATRAEVHMARRRTTESQAPARPRGTPHREADWRELEAVVQEELGRLPEKFRAPFVLCCLEGKSRAEAAGELGWKEGTVAGRLAQARKLLQDRLTRRGLTLSTVLCLTFLGRPAAAAVPARLAGPAVRAAVLAAGGGAVTGLIPERIATLADGAHHAMSATKLKSVALLLALAAAAAGGLLARPPAAAPPSAEGEKPAASPERPGGPDTVEGRVLGHDGRPVAGAAVRVGSGAAKAGKGWPVRATTGADGRFRFTASKAEMRREATLVVTAAGHGSDWVELGPAGKPEALTLRLGREVPIQGRVLTLEGEPVAGASVEVLRAEKPRGKDLTAWVQTWARNRDPKAIHLDGSALGSAKVTTDKAGRFSLGGFGPERAVLLRVGGEDIERALLWALTRPGNGPVREAKGITWARFYLARFDHAAGPTKPVVGTVRDKRTGKPVAGITLMGGYTTATTDSRGRYRLVGGAKRERYDLFLSAEGKRGLPYFPVLKRDIRDTQGLEPVTADFELEPGLEVSGRLLDAGGKPVPGQVKYVNLPDNPNLKDYLQHTYPGHPVIGGGLGGTGWSRAGDDGRFTAPALPGPGLLLVRADEERRFAMLEPGKEFHAAHGISSQYYTIGYLHAIVPIKPSADRPKSLRQDVVLEPGRSLAGRVVGPDGKPVTGAYVAGLGELDGFDPIIVGEPMVLDGAEFTAHGLNPRHPRAVFFFHPGKKLSRLLVVRGDEPAPLVVHLQPLVSVRGRLVDAGGLPVKGATVSTFPFQWGSLPEDLARLNFPAKELMTNGLSQVLWKHAEARRATTDDKGEFLLEGLVPGVPYDLVLLSGRAFGHRVNHLIPPAGQDTKLGDLKFGAVTDLRKPAPKPAPKDKGSK
jgi:RNA polymerase sigma factor (sigma-70 family)